MKIDMVTERSHYRDHVLPIFDALPAEIRGTDWGDKICPDRERILIVGGYSDIKRHLHNRVIYVEHGAGQSYIGLAPVVQPFYSGGGQHRNTIAFLCPNDEVAGRWLGRYPNKPAFVVGCPRLDPWHSGDRGEHEPRTVAVTFHWDAKFTGVPETESAFGHYFSVLREAVQDWRRLGWHVIGHNHPRYPAVAEFWTQAEMAVDVEYVSDSAEVLSRAHILVADNTSLQAEFLSLGRPVVWLNHPAYRKDVSHGGRFWTWPKTLGGTQIDTPTDLLYLDLDSVPSACGHPYAFADGHATQRAVDAILSLL